MVEPLRELVLASGNAGKLRELQALFANTGVVLVPQSALGVTDADEPHGTFVENALAKARHACLATGRAALADDSGVCVPALGGAPGVYSARYAALDGGPRNDAANNARLLRELAAQSDRRAYFYCVLVLLRHANDPQPVIADGVWYGLIVDPAAGGGGFGYDPHFWLPALGQTAAQLDEAQKNQLSHRGQAMRALLVRLREQRLMR